MTSDNRLDRAIDDVAREMTSGDANANLRARVLADIERPRAFAWRPLVAVAAVAAAILAAINIGRLSQTSAPSPTVPALSLTVPAPSPTVPVPSLTVPAPSPTVPAPSPTVPALSLTVPSPSEPVPSGNVRARNGTASGVYPFVETPLAEESIAVAPIAPEALAPPTSIAVEDIPSITPIAITPIGPGEQK